MSALFPVALHVSAGAAGFVALRSERLQPRIAAPPSQATRALMIDLAMSAAALPLAAAATAGVMPISKETSA